MKLLVVGMAAAILALALHFGSGTIQEPPATNAAMFIRGPTGIIFIWYGWGGFCYEWPYGDC